MGCFPHAQIQTEPLPERVPVPATVTLRQRMHRHPEPFALLVEHDGEEQAEGMNGSGRQRREARPR